MPSPKIAALVAVLMSLISLNVSAQDQGHAGPLSSPPSSVPANSPEALAAPIAPSATYAAPPGVAEQWVWLTDQKLWGFGYQLQDGPYKGKWRLKLKTASPATATQAGQGVVQTSYTTAQPAASYGDPTGFVAILNQMRASAGLPLVAYDANLSSWASQNNAAQNSRGLGHHVNPGALQNSGWNYASAASVAQGWMASPGHRAAMFAAGISRVGIAYGPGPYWTMNAQ